MLLISAAMCLWRLALNVAYKPDRYQRVADYYRMMQQNAQQDFQIMGLGSSAKFLAHVVEYAGVQSALELRVVSRTLLNSAEDLVEEGIWASDNESDMNTDSKSEMST